MPAQKIGHCFFGVDYATPPHELHPYALADAQNMIPSPSGLPVGRNGSARLNSTSLGSRVTSFHEFRAGTTTRDKLCSYSTKIAKYNSATGDFDDKITGLTSDKMTQWVNFASKAICVNEGSDVPQYWNGTIGGDLAGSPPTGLTIAEWSNRLWFGGDSTQVARLTGSAINDPTDYTGAAATATDAIQTTIGDSGDPITGLFGFFDMLLIGKKNNIYKLTGTPATDITTIAIAPLYSKGTDNIGFTSPWAITQVGNDVIFLDGFDIKRLSGIQEFGDVESATIIPHFRDYLESIADKDYLQYTQFFHYKQSQQIWVSIPTGAATHFVFCLDYRFKDQTERYSFYPMSGITVNVFGGVEDGEVVNMHFGDEVGYVYQMDTGNNDDNDTIERFATFMVSGNQPDQQVVDRHVYRKQFINTEMFILPSGTSVSVTPSYAVDLMDDAQIRTSGNYTSINSENVTNWDGTGVLRKRIPFLGLSGNTLALKFTHNALDENITIYPSEINYKWKKKTVIT
ncbi:hypothetical protein ACFL3R_00595 [Thermodesulfobacteriota bacterium]